MFAFALTGMIGISAGEFTQTASAQENTFSIRTTLQDLLGTNRQRPVQQQREQPQQETPATPVVTQEVTPAPTPTPAVTQQPQNSNQVAQQVQAPIETTPADTAPQIELTTSAQAKIAGQPVTYVSRQISSETRDQLLLAATIGIVVGILLLLLSLALPKSEVVQARKSMRIKIPVREAVTQ